MINYSLRFARLSQKKGRKRWVEDIKRYFTKCLDRDFEGSSFEFSVTVGEYLANLYYLDNKWVFENINRIFPKDDEEHWKAAFVGYLFTSSMLSFSI